MTIGEPIVVRLDTPMRREESPYVTPRRRTSMSSRRCSTQRSGPWSWRRELERARAALPRFRGASRGRGPRPRRRVVGGRGDGTRRRHGWRSRGAPVARNGVNVVTVDSAPGMQPDVVSRSEDIPFADESFDAAVCRVAAHHFDDVPKAMSEMARVSRDRVIVVDNLFLDDDAEEADSRARPVARQELVGRSGARVRVRRAPGRRGATTGEADRGRALARAGRHERSGRQAGSRAARRLHSGRLDHTRPTRDPGSQVRRSSSTTTPSSSSRA